MEAPARPRLLLVEDENALRSTLRLNFELEGYDVTTVANGPDALERLRSAHYDAVVMDVMLPGMDGFTVVETIRLEGNSTPVLFLTARTAAPDRVRGLKAGEDHLGKPFDLEELSSVVERRVRIPCLRGTLSGGITSTSRATRCAGKVA